MEKNKNFLIIRLKKNREKVRLATIFAFLIAVSMPFSTINIGGVGILFLIGIPLLILCAPIMINGIKKTSWKIETLLLICFFMYGIMAYVWTPSLSGDSIYNYMKNVLVVACLYCQPFNKKEKDVLLSGAIISCLIVCWFMLTDNSNVGYLEGRASIAIFGVLQDPNYLGFVFIVPMAVVVYCFLNNKDFVIKGFCVVVASIILYCVLLTGSRGALVGLIAVAFVNIINKFENIWAKVTFCTLMIVLSILLFGYILKYLPSEIAMRFSIQDIIESRGTSRGDIWMKAFKTMYDFPYMTLFGFGTGSSVAVIGKATHNYIIQLLLELGIVGTGLFMFFLLRSCWKMRNDTLCLSIIGGCMGLAMTLSVNTNYYFWITMTLALACSRERRC